ncbi:MAG: calcium/sodium antiporter, partial [Acidobacteria bacterium]|nr:calcium/sodium antiporter [Acidobacteriota bacterium]
TVVAFGTSSPELAATLTAAIKGAPEVALGNVLGSNIANLGLILGISALLQPLVAHADFLRREIPFLVAIGVLLVLLAMNGRYGRADGILLLCLFAGYLWVLLRKGEAPAIDKDEKEAAEKGSLWVQGLLVVGGIAVLVVGADLMVRGAVSLARSFGLSEQVIGLSLVAVGTSLPELATSVVAAAKGEADIVLGNVVGSNIFNVLLVLATTAVIRPVPVSLDAFGRDMGVGLLLSIAVLPLLVVGQAPRLARYEGACLLGAYVLYLVWIF